MDSTQKEKNQENHSPNRKVKQWSKMKEDKQYKDTVSNITNIILKAVPGSQI